MEYLTTLRRARNLFFTAFIVNILLVLLTWGFVMLGWMDYFMWGLPGFTAAAANAYVLGAIGLIDTLGCVLFLTPTLALTWAIVCEKRKAPRKRK